MESVQISRLRALWATRPCHVLPSEFNLKPWFQIDLSVQNSKMPPVELENLLSLEGWLFDEIEKARSRVGYGGYDEVRSWYHLSPHFSGPKGPRSVHLGVDLWVPPGTPVLATWDGEIHSFKNNSNYLDYGPTIILKHTSDENVWHSLHGHLSLRSLENLSVGMKFKAGDSIATTGNSKENGAWIPHLHFQLIKDLQGWVGDYPGVSTAADRENFLANCPDPAWLLKPTLVNSK